MRAAVLQAPGPPECFSIESIPEPEIGEDEVLLRVLACGISSKDIIERSGVYRRDMTFPIVIGMEICGEVLRCGRLVADLKIGARVATKAFASCSHCNYCRNGRETTCLQRRAVRGGYGEFAAIPSDACVVVPDDMPPEIACTLGPGAGVALNAVRDTARVTLGEWVLVTGASGGVGLPALQIAKAMQARTIVVTRDPSNADLLKGASAGHAVVIEPGNSFSRAVRDLTNGAGVDVVIDTVGSAVFQPAFDSLALHGRYALVGQLTADETSINLARIFFKRAQLLGVGSVSRTQLQDAIDLVHRSIVRPIVARVLPLSEIAQAHRLVEAGRQFGRIVAMP